MTKRLLSFLGVSLMLGGTATAQLTGVKAIPGDYATVAAAVTALNSSGVGAGGVTFDVAAGHTETSTIPALTATGTAANPIVFQKSGSGSNPVLTPASAGTVASSTTLGNNGDAILVIAGGDYITFDGINLQANASHSSGNARFEYGYMLKKASATDACKNVTIRNCSISLNGSTTIYSFGVFVSNYVGTSSVTVSSTGGRHENIKLYGLTISNCYGGIQQRGYAHTTAPYEFLDQNIDIGVDGANTITNYGGASTAYYGIFTIYGNNVRVANNVISGGGGTGSNYGINTSTAANANVDIYSNTISPVSSATTNEVYPIYNTAGASGTNNTINIYNNTVQNLTWTTATSGILYGVYANATAMNINIYGNTVQNCAYGGTSGASNLIYNATSAANAICSLYNNTIQNNTATGTGDVFCVYSSPSTTSTSYVFGNTVRNNSSGDIIYGVQSNAGAQTQIYNNKISELTTSGTAATTRCYGISSTTGTTTIYNNLIGNLTATASTDTMGVIGISMSGGTAMSAYYNTVYLNATSSGATFGTTGISASVTPTVELINNAVINTSAAAGTGRTIAYRRSSGDLSTYSSASNNNSFYAGSPSATNLIYYDGSSGDQTLLAYKARVAPRDNASVSGNPTFLSTNGASANFLHVDPSVPTQLEGSGIPVAGVTTDYDGATRDATTPDIGADEFAGIPVDVTAPAASFTPLTFTCATGDRTLDGVVITDASGAVINGPNSPRIYYKKGAGGAYVSSAGTLVAGSPTNSTWDFTITAADLGGLTVGDVVYYFIAAEDIAGNVGSTPVGGFGSDVNNVTPPTTAYSYHIAETLMGNYTVGTGGAYPTLTAAVSAYNNNCVSGAVTFELLNASYGAGETFPLQFVANQSAGSGNTLTIRPAAGVATTITGSSSALAVFKFTDARYITLDGLNSGGSSLSITSSNAASSAVIWLASNGPGSQNMAIRNTTITGASNTLTYGIVASDNPFNPASFTPTTAGADNDNAEISGNTFLRLLYGVYATGTSAGSLNGWVVSNNTIGPATNGADNLTRTGIYLGTHVGPSVTGNVVQNIAATGSGYHGIHFVSNVTGGTISQNTIRSLSSSTSASSNSSISGINVGTGCTGLLIERNAITDVLNTYSSSGLGYGARGISVSTGNAASNLTIANNMVSNVRGMGYSSAGATYAGIGIALEGTTGGVQLYFNSVHMNGAIAGHAVATTSMGLYVASGVTSLDIRNNIFVNSFDNTGSTTDVAYAVYSAASNSAFTTMDYNDYWVPTGSANAVYSLGYLGGDITTLSAFQSAFGGNLNSINTLPSFTSASDLHLTTSGNAPFESTGTPVSVTNDFDGITRNATTPDIGADEFAAASCTTPPTPGVTAISPTTPVCIGNTVTFSLTGNSTGLTQTYQLQYSATQNGQYSNVGSASTSPVNSSAVLAAGYYRYLVTCSGQSDSSTPVLVNAYQNMTGAYTINSGAPTANTNFQSFRDAALALGCGVGGAVTIDVVAGSGPYNEQVVFNAIPSASATNTVTLNGNGAVLNFSAASGDESYAGVKLNGSDYMTVRDLTVNVNGTLGFGFQLTNDADNSAIKGCTVNISVAETSSNFAGIAVSGGNTSATTTGSNCDNVTIDSNTIIGGYYGVTLYGSSSTSVTNNRIAHNTIQDNYGAGIQVSYNNSLVIEGNDISRPTRTGTTTYYGIYLTTGNVGAAVSKNRIHNTSDAMPANTSTLGGIYLNGSDGTTAQPNVVSNNLIYAFNHAGPAYGLYNVGSDTAYYCHNTVSFDNTTPTGTSATRGFYQATTASTGLVLKNNIFTISRGTTGDKHALYFNLSATTYTSDYNNYVMASTAGTVNNVAYIAGTQYVTLANLQSGTPGDDSSRSIDPAYTDPNVGDFLPTATTLNNLGTPAGILTDILNVNRSVVRPDMGAYEFLSPPLAIGLVDITATNVGARNRVEWRTSSESYGDQYAIERSADGRVFKIVRALTPARGTASQYTWWDETPLSGVNYYRLRMADGAGGVSYSRNVMAFVKTASDFSLQVFPNPVVSGQSQMRVRVNGAIVGQAEASLMDAAGKTLQRVLFAAGTSEASFDFSKFPAGFYTLHYTDGARTETVKVTKQ